MAIPDYQNLMLPLLSFAADGEEHSVREAREHLAVNLGLTDEEREKNMPPKHFSCLQCGHCCLSLGSELSATAGDVALWEKHGRDDILAWVDEVAAGIYDIWIHPRTGEDVRRCPWLRKLPRQEKFICRIQDLKPEVCRNYPVSREHGEATGCKGLSKYLTADPGKIPRDGSRR